MLGRGNILEDAAGVLTGPGGTIEKEKTRPRLALTNRGRAGII